MRLIVTGGLGFIGSNFITWMLENINDVEILNIDRGDHYSSINNVTQWKSYTRVKIDIADESAMETLFDCFRPDVVINYAEQNHLDKKFDSPIQYTRDNVLGTHVLLHTAYKYGKLEKFIHMSTDEVGEGENSLVNPITPYAASKAGAEFIVRSYGHSFNFPYIIVRVNNVYGPKQYPDRLIPLFINNILNKKTCEIHGDGFSRRSFIFVDDVSVAMHTILTKGALKHTYNIGSTREYNVLEIFNILKDMIDPSATHVFVDDRPFNKSRHCIDSSELRKLGWRDEVAFKDGLMKTIEWYKKRFEKMQMDLADAVSCS